MERLSSMNGTSSSRASNGPSVDLPAPRRPTSAMRRCLAASLCPPLSSSCSARRARRSSGSLRCSSSSRISSHSGDCVVKSPTSSASEQCRAWATCCSTRMEALPVPYSRLARWRSDTSAATATALRVRPRCARRLRTRSPSATSRGFLGSSADGGAPSCAEAGESSPAVFVSFIPILFMEHPGLLREDAIDALWCLTWIFEVTMVH